MVRRLVDEMSEELAPSSVRTYYGVLEAAMTSAVDHDLVGRSPCRGIRLAGDRRRDPAFLSMKQLHDLARAIDPRYAAFVYLGGVVGLRIGEIAGLRVEDIDFLTRTVTIRSTLSEVRGHLVFGEPKTKMSRRTIGLPQEVVAVLAEHMERHHVPNEHGLVFTGPQGGPIRRNHFRRRVWQPVVGQLGLDDLTFHGLRHTAVGLLIELGTHPRVIQQRMGHASIRTTMDVYGSVLEEVDDEATRGLGDLMSRSSRGLRLIRRNPRHGLSGLRPGASRGGGEGS